MTAASRLKILNALRGQKIRLADMHAFFKGWPQDTHPELERIREDVDKWFEMLDTSIGSSVLLVNMLTAFPETDSEVGRLASDVEAANVYRENTLNYISDTLGLSNHGTVPADTIIAHFKTVADVLVRDASEEKRKRLLEEMEYL
ncbi:hypothetical protein K402DRAFT_405232 [Aulographum hederae CBS 113979]|uniref:Uncharacterized protein n=1 Tax=Aulographum hederae CBS 113979 TaxID=1176131 RepID=A0A6G1GX94_9PEZI|nr:hypothetical protein K402DRAFT_405232 [Aulographum hederae CBS 113979]